MDDKSHILQKIKKSVTATDPGATLILYGSYARGDFRDDSDIDILVLIDKENVTYDDLKRISSPIYDIELDAGIIISPAIYTKKGWASHKVTPFYENVNREGIML
jgi:predicted nucleotidyltransferase